MTRERILVWLDIETTGLDKNAQIVEFAVVNTDSQGGSSLWRACPWIKSVIHVPARHWDDQEALMMHIDSGLFADSQRTSATLDGLWPVLHDYLKDRLEEGECQLAGFGCGFDRKLLEEYAPDYVLNCLKRFHRTDLNLSVVREILRHVGGVNALCNIDQEGTRHRAYDDCVTAIRYYRKLVNAFGEKFAGT